MKSLPLVIFSALSAVWLSSCGSSNNTGTGTGGAAEGGAPSGGAPQLGGSPGTGGVVSKGGSGGGAGTGGAPAGGMGGATAGTGGAPAGGSGGTTGGSGGVPAGGTGGMTGAAGAGGYANGAGCPGTNPGDATTCATVTAGTYCEYGSDSCLCLRGNWTCHAMDATCPGSAPMAGGMCTTPQQDCLYPNEECVCGGNNMWNCVLAQDPLCPPPPAPADMSDCTGKENVTCNYGTSTCRCGKMTHLWTCQ